MLKTVAVIGVGLIGGSLSSGLREKRWCETVIGIDSDESAIANALRLNVIDQGYTSITDCDYVPDLVVIAVPVLKVGAVSEKIKTWFASAKAVTDVASTKQKVINDVHHVFDAAIPNNFVPGHPIAGREQSGVQAATSNLFENRRVILTPLENTSVASSDLVKSMWQALGANVETLTAEVHDKILAATSHLPHALAFSLVHCLASQSHTEEIFRYAAGGFADFSRIASSDPVLWKEICLANQSELLDAIVEFENCLKELRTGLENRDGEALERIFLNAKTTRDRFTQ